MEMNPLNRMVRHLRRGTAPHDGADLADGALLECYRTGRDEAAFEALVRRHGPMVLGVCRRILRNEADAEDAFQATFLVLVRKARSIRQTNLVANWLYGVAHNTALKAKAMNGKRRAKEHEAGMLGKPGAAKEVWWQVQMLVDEGLSRLADKYRVPIVLCDLEGRTIQEAARHLGWPPGTVATRLTRGRALLARRLSGTGLKLSAVALAAVLSQGAAAASVPAPLLSATVKAANVFAAGTTTATGVISASVAALTQGVLHAMLLSKIKAISATLLLVGVLGTGVGASILAGQTPPDEPAAAQPAGAQKRTRPKADAPVLPPARQAEPAKGDAKADALKRQVEELKDQVARLREMIVVLEEKLATSQTKEKKQSVVPPAPKTQVKIFALRNAECQEIAMTLTQLLQPLDGGGGFRNAPAPLRSPRIATHQSSNSVLVQGTEEDLEMVEGIISRLDELPAAPKKKTAIGEGKKS